LARLRYLPLDAENNEIRLLSIAPGLPVDDVKCKLFHVSMDDPRRPSYQALSYTWTDHSTTALEKPATFASNLFSRLGHYFRQWSLLPPHQIYVGEQIVEVTNSLGEAIRQLRSIQNNTIIWIDAICINQDDVFERNHQVSKMRNIYEDAEQVVVWLGPERDESRVAFSFVRDLNKVSNSPYWIRRMINEPKTLTHLDTLYSLFRREYWYRIWPVQEVTCAKAIVVYCGSDSISWSELSGISPFMIKHQLELVRRLPSKTHYMSVFTSGGPASSRTLARSDGEVSKPHSLLELLLSHLHKHATDPRDKVYALVGMSLARDDPRFTLDYSLSVSEVYTNVVNYEINATRKLDIICAHNPGSSTLALPSWVPDWAAPNMNDYINGLHLRNPAETHAAGSSQAEFRRSDDGTILYVRGFSFDITEAVGQPCEEDRKSYVILDHVLTTFHNWRKLYITANSDLGADGVLDYKAFCRTLFCDTYTPWGSITAISRPYDGYLGAFGRLLRENFPNLSLDEELNKFANSTEWNQGNMDLDKAFVKNISEMMRGRCFFVSSSKLIGLAPKRTVKGDMICVLLGCSFPVILRKQSDHFILIGAAYVHGYMDGKAMEGLISGKDRVQEFEIH
jgi:Heterokaryon incompatibility protein (HET)